jgi:hypothetical protein
MTKIQAAFKQVIKKYQHAKPALTRDNLALQNWHASPIIVMPLNIIMRLTGGTGRWEQAGERREVGEICLYRVRVTGGL